MADFKYVECIAPSSMDLLDTLKDQITGFTTYPTTQQNETPTDNTWEVAASKTDTATGKTSELILKATATIGTGANALTKTFYVKMANPCFTTATKHSTLTVQIGDNFDQQSQTVTNLGHPVNYEWADQSQTTDRDKTKPIYVYMSINNNRIAMVLVGDPSVNFNDYRKSFLYVGAIKPFDYNMNDAAGNVLLTAGAVTQEPANPTSGYNFGQFTSFGNNTFQMLGTYTGLKYQKYYPAFMTQAPPVGKAYRDQNLGDTGLLLEATGFNASIWTKRYHMSPIYVVHPYEGYRGMLDGVLAVTKNNVLHLDEFTVDVTGKPWTQEVYKYFDHNTEMNFMNSSANVKMGIAFLKGVN